METKELRSQVLQLKQERAIYELNVERTFDARVNKAIKSAHGARMKALEQQRARDAEDLMVRQVLSAKTKDAGPLDVFVLAKVVQKQRDLIANLIDEAACSKWLIEHPTDFKAGSIPQLDHMAEDLLAIADDAVFAEELPLLHTLGFSKAHLVDLGIWPTHPTPREESVEETVEKPEPMAPPVHPSPIDNLDKEAWTWEVMDECLAMTASFTCRRPLDPEAEGAARVDPPYLLEIVNQYIRTKVYYEPNDKNKIIRNERILGVTGRFKHPSGETVDVQVDVSRLKAGRNSEHYSEQVRRFFKKERPLRA